MKFNQFRFLLPIVILVLSCIINQTQNEFERLGIWEEVRVAAKEKRIDFLLEMSKDTLDCIECNDGESRMSKEDFFANHLDQIEISDTKKYSVFSEKYEGEKGFTKRYRINYSYGEGGQGESHISIYTILTGENRIQFQGVIGVP